MFEGGFNPKRAATRGDLSAEHAMVQIQIQANLPGLGWASMGSSSVSPRPLPFFESRLTWTCIGSCFLPPRPLPLPPFPDFPFPPSSGISRPSQEISAPRLDHQPNDSLGQVPLTGQNLF